MHCAPQVIAGENFTTYRIGGPLEQAYLPASEEELIRILEQHQAIEAPLTILGWGGNSIIASRGIQGTTVITRKLDWVEPISETRIAFGAGVHLAKSASAALKYGLTGGEYMIGIPGTIGGAIRMNAGALGQETSHLIESVRLFNRDSGAVETWLPEDLGFSYRKSNIQPEKHIILSTVLKFEPGDMAKIQETMTQSVQFRRAHHPKEPNGGSVFKNPQPDMPVGKLMQDLGAKGNWKVGGAMVSPLHGNFIVNINNATSTDVLRLMLRMKRAIFEQYGLDTHPENLLLGDATEEEQTLWQTLQAPSH